VTTLDQIPIGKRCRLQAMVGPPSLVQRLLELGVMEGEEVTVLTRAPLGDPIEIESPLARLSLRRAEAVQVHVTPLD
jgi:Fe2+ transport system protein FeoA